MREGEAQLPEQRVRRTPGRLGADPASAHEVTVPRSPADTPKPVVTGP